MHEPWAAQGLPIGGPAPLFWLKLFPRSRPSAVRRPLWGQRQDPTAWAHSSPSICPTRILGPEFLRPSTSNLLAPRPLAVCSASLSSLSRLGFHSLPHIPVAHLPHDEQLALMRAHTVPVPTLAGASGLISPVTFHQLLLSD